MTAPDGKGAIQSACRIAQAVVRQEANLASARQEASLIAAGRSEPTRTCATVMNANAATAGAGLDRAEADAGAAGRIVWREADPPKVRLSPKRFTARFGSATVSA
ncbi:hypothetical protein A4R29_23835 [Mesorhizobium ciceri biovar biserrulae]|nr:hypothetical protein A4R29_23835 [Mesorhizobium ciceri biovar biserrulae]